MSGNPFLQTTSPGSASRSKTVVRQKYIARQPSQEYFDDEDYDVQGDFSEFEGNMCTRIDSRINPNVKVSNDIK
jgi:hypothetical protein